ncbi:MAG TPA: septal ring lytic transglycosylase RlpA family protein [Micromonosporaceae bacterium]
MPAAAAVTVAGLLVGGASAAIGLSPASNVSKLPAFDPADIPPPDPAAGEAMQAPNAAPAPLATQADDATNAEIVAAGSCKVSYMSAGGKTASGETFDPNALTAGHKSLPFDTMVRVTNPANGESVVVRINDRGPGNGDRCLNLSEAAFASIAKLSQGVVNVRYEVLAQDAT